jgi:hypothetical protein
LDPTSSSALSDSSRAGATITSTYRLGRVLRGVPLALAVLVRQIAWGGLDDELAPSYLHLTDQPTGRKIRIGLGREPVAAEKIRVAIEGDLDLLTREQFIEK